MSSATFSLTRQEIAGVSVAELAAQHGTPCYVYDAGTIEERVDELRAFDVIRYAQKACSNLAILDFVRRRGVLVDAVSAGEIRRAMADWGVDGFKLDGGDAVHYSDGRMLTGAVAHDESASPNLHAQAFAEIGLDYPLNEYRATWKMGGSG